METIAKNCRNSAIAGVVLLNCQIFSPMVFGAPVGVSGTSVVSDGAGNLTVQGDSSHLNQQSVIHRFSDFNVSADETLTFKKHESLTGNVKNLIANITSGRPAMIEGNVSTSGYDHAAFYLLSSGGLSFIGPEGQRPLLLNHNGPVVLSTASGFTFSENGLDQVRLVFNAASGKVLLRNLELESGSDINSGIAVLGSSVELDNASVFIYESEGGKLLLRALGDTAGSTIGVDGMGVPEPSEHAGRLSIRDSVLGEFALWRPSQVALEGGVVDVSGTLIETEIPFQRRSEFQHGLAVSSTHQVTFNDGVTVLTQRGINISSANGSVEFNVGKESENYGRISLDLSEGQGLGLSISGQSITLNQTDISAGSVGTAEQKSADVHLDADGELTLTDTQLTSESKGLAGSAKLRLEAGGNIVLSDGTLVSATSNAGEAVGGDIVLETTQGSIRLSGASQVNSETGSDGKGGDISILAKSAQVHLTGASGISASTKEKTKGDGGNITIQSSELVLQDSSSVAASTAANSFGKGGNIDVDVKSLALAGGSRISAASAGAGQSGTVTIRASDITVLASDVSVQTVVSNAGDVVIFANKKFTMDDGATISSAVGGENVKGGNVYINRAVDDKDNAASPAGQSLFLLNNGKIVTRVGDQGTGEGGSVYINHATGDNLVVMGEDALIDTSALGPSAAARRAVTSNDTAPAVANGEGVGGNLEINALKVYRSPGTTINTRGSQAGLDGDVTIITPELDETSGLIALPESFLDQSRLVGNRCVARHKKGSSSLVASANRADGGAPEPFEAVTPRQLVAYQQGSKHRNGRETSVLKVMPVDAVDCRSQ